MNIAQLWRYPVKSMQGIPVERIDLDELGAVGDRRWAVVDPAAGKALSAKRWPSLLLAATAVDDASGAVTVILPDGTEVEAGDPATDAALSAWLDHRVELRRAATDASLPFEMHTDASDDTSPTFEFTGPPGRWVDLAAAHLLTTASLRAAAALHPDGSWDVRRFRPEALVDADGDGFVEEAWVGATVRLGADVVIEPLMPTVRCSMTTRAQPGLDRDVGIAKTLNAHNNLNLGVYGKVVAGGTLAVGDQVVVHSPDPA